MKFILIIFSALVCICSARDETKYCPQLSDYGPCYCKHGFFYDVTGTRVSCSRVNDTDVLYNEIQKFRGYPIDLLRLTELNLPYFKAGLFMGISVKSIVMEMSALENLYSIHQNGPSPFNGLGDSLQELSISTTQGASNWYWPDMSNLTNLKTIEINFTPINFVGHVFAEFGKGSLDSISVTYSNVYRVHPQAFPELTNLKLVSLRGNKLPYMVRTMFPDPAPQLKTIDLRNNLLFNFPENMFSNMPALQFLDISRNKFVELQEVVFTPIWNTIGNLYLADNPLKCDCNLKWLYNKIIEGSVPKYNDFEFVTCTPEGKEAAIPLKQAGDFMKC